MSILGNLGQSLVIRDDMVGCLGLRGEGVLGYVSSQNLSLDLVSPPPP